DKGELDTRKEIIVPDSAHGTNPATAKMAGFKVVVVPSNERGCVDTKALEAVVSEKTAGIMLTNPNTLGLFEEEIDKIAEIVHGQGAKLYYDGANLNANLGRVRPGDIGFDVVHVNLHKSFSTPHGGGGPGSGCIAVCSDLEPYLPVPIVAKRPNGVFYLDYNKPKSIGKVKGFYGNINVILKAYAYIMALGADGLRDSSESAVLASNYILAKLKGTKGLELPYDPKKPRKHEVIFSAEPIKKATGVTAGDIAHRILDYGMHAPTNYFPTIVHEALMIEPTESFDKAVLDNYVEAIKQILENAFKDPEYIKRSPYTTAVGSVDEAKASRMNEMALTWRMYQKRLMQQK
ncbi:MAG: aminomethyl-transferring glycine dehydrogenase subunit GcvPB, partial [Candidatus Ranarchaeia archaeon]